MQDKYDRVFEIITDLIRGDINKNECIHKIMMLMEEVEKDN